MRPKMNFCMPEYLDLATCNKELTKYTGRCTTFFLAVSLGFLLMSCSLLLDPYLTLPVLAHSLLHPLLGVLPRLR